MAKIDVKQIIQTGTPKQRIVLLIEEIALNTTGKQSLLSKEEYQALIDSFKSQSELKIYNKYKDSDKVVKTILPYLNQVRLLYRVQKTKIDDLLLLVTSYFSMINTIDKMLNSVQDDNVKDKLLEIAIKNSDFILAKALKNKYFNIDDSDGLSYLHEIIIPHKQLAINLLIQIKAIIQILKEFNQKNSFHIKAYKDMVLEIENDVTNKSLMTKYNDIFSSNNEFFPDYENLLVDESTYSTLKDSLL